MTRLNFGPGLVYTCTGIEYFSGTPGGRGSVFISPRRGSQVVLFSQATEITPLRGALVDEFVGSFLCVFIATFSPSSI